MTQTAPDSKPSKAETVEQEQHSDLSPVTQTEKAPANWLSGGRGIVMGMVLGIILALVGSRFLASQQSDATPEALPAASPTAAAQPGQSVTVATVETASVERTLEATGSVDAFEMIPVLSQATGLQIQQVLVDEGEFVKAGQLMARLDDSVLQAQLTQAKAAVTQAEARLAELRAGTRSEEIAQSESRLNQAKARLSEAQASIPRRIDQAKAQVESAQARLNLAQERYQSLKDLVDQGAVTRDRYNEGLSEYRSAQANLSEAQQRLEQARSTNTPEVAQLQASVAEAEQQLEQLRAGTRREVITQAEAQLAEAKGRVQAITAQLKDTRVVAPASGKIAERNARVGDVTSGSEKLFTIIENGRLELKLEIPETQLKQIRPGQSVKVTSDIDSNLQLSGKVREIDPMVDRESRQAIVKVDLPAEDSLRVGMFLRGLITTQAATGLTVPTQAVLPQSEGSAIVYRLQADNTAKAVPVEMGEIMPGEKVEITSGLSVGDRLAVKGAAYLKDGDKVEVVETVEVVDVK